MVRTGVNRRQVTQLRAALKAGNPVNDIAKAFNVYPEVVFNFARNWKIKVEDTPESVALIKHEATIEHEVRKRIKAKEEKKELEDLAAENKKAIDNLNLTEAKKKE